MCLKYKPRLPGYRRSAVSLGAVPRVPPERTVGQTPQRHRRTTICPQEVLVVLTLKWGEDSVQSSKPSPFSWLKFQGRSFCVA